MAKKPAATHDRVIENRKARHDYHILETVECGVILRGPEVKALRQGLATITDGYVRANAQPLELTAFGIDIQPYGPAGPRQHNPKRARGLLAHKREIIRLAKQAEDKGMTLVPLKLYFKNGYAKVLVGVARGKQAHDKRRAIADRESKRDLARAISKRAR
ncbi:MAG: SsrA-binding protein SmpB [Phycisphaeraceae bacterium]|nr:MAG: SsrA-binding protein SmpB [Phycisphaeraceae bacterium]